MGRKEYGRYGKHSRRDRRKKKGGIISTVILIVAICVFAFSAFQLYKIFNGYHIEPEHLMAGLLKVGENVTNFIFQKVPDVLVGPTF